MRRVLLASLLILSGLLPGIAPPLAMAQEDSGDAPVADAPAPDDSPPAAPDPATPWWQWQGGDTSFGADLGPYVFYQKFWNTRVEAFGAPSEYEGELMLKELLDGDALSRELDALHKLAATGRAQVVQVDHHIGYGFIGDEDWVVFDKYVDHSYLVDARTRQAVDGGPRADPVTWSMGYHFHKLPYPSDAATPYRWKIVDSVHLTD